MKRTLRLRAETVRRLTAADLERVTGGDIPRPTATCQSYTGGDSCKCDGPGPK